MEVSALIEDLRRIPITVDDMTSFENKYDLLNRSKRSDIVIDSALVAEEVAEYVFKERNIPDDFFEAYSDSFTKATDSLYHHYLEVLDKENIRSTSGFISNLKGKIFELRALDEMAGEPDISFELAEKANQPIWDMLSRNIEGTVDYFQAKIGGDSYFYKVVKRIEENPDLNFILGNELYDKAISRFPELKEQFIKIGIGNDELTSEVSERLDVLIGNMGIDVPDEIGDLLPYLGEVVLGIKLLIELSKNKKELKHASYDLTKKTAIVKTIALISKFGVKSIVGWACGAVGVSVGGPFAPFTGLIGSVGGIVSASMLIKKLEPQLIDIIQDLLNIEEDVLYYYRNKLHIDRIGYNYSTIGLN